MRFIGSLIIACIITLGLFLLMYRLVNHQQLQVVKPPALMTIDVRQLTLPEQKVQQKISEAKAEPALAALPITPLSTTPLDSDLKIEMPDANLQWQNSELSFEQKYWSQPGAEGGEGDGIGQGNGGNPQGAVDDYIGEMNAGKKERVPTSSSRPNIPKTAYDNHIDGWVLLAYTVTAAGDIKNIRVMDAYPRGIFEANAIAAVRGWKYDVFKGPDVQLAQRIEFEWSMYPYNMDRR